MRCAADQSAGGVGGRQSRLLWESVRATDQGSELADTLISEVLDACFATLRRDGSSDCFYWLNIVAGRAVAADNSVVRASKVARRQGPDTVVPHLGNLCVADELHTLFSAHMWLIQSAPG